MNVTDTLDHIKGRSGYRLANDADVTGPDALDSPAAKFLSSVRDAVVEWWEYNEYRLTEDPSEAAFMQTDACVSVYTHEFWLTFVDLCAYSEDISDLGTPEDLETGARWAVHGIAERLFVTLANELIEARDE